MAARIRPLPLLLLVWVALVDARARLFTEHASVAFLSPSLASSSQTLTPSTIRSMTVRGGAEDDSDDESDDESEAEDDSEEEDKEEEEVVVVAPKKQPTAKKAPALDTKLAASTLKKEATSKTKASKQAVNAKLSVPKKQKKRMSLRIPYILRACLNPITLVKMAAAYWQSLFQLDYGKQDSSQELRSALQTKARTQGGGKKPSTKPRRGGRATTINDLPKLNT